MSDVVLLCLCKEFHRLRAAALDLPDAEIEGFCTELKIRREMYSSILALPVTTAAGREAMASVVAVMLSDGIHPFEAQQLACC